MTSESLDELFERYESLPSHDAEDEKRGLVDRILVGIADRLAGVDAGDDRYRTVRDTATRLRLLAPAAAGFDDAVLRLIDAARESFGDEPLAGALPARTPARTERPEPSGEVVTGASEDSFPASDAPGYAVGDGSA